MKNDCLKFKIRLTISVFFVLFGIVGYTDASMQSVPFISQAPFGSWAVPYQDFCEEASVVMAAHWVWNVPITPTIADTEMKIIKQLEGLLFGHSKDNSAEEMATVLKTLYGMKNVAVKEVAVKQELIAELTAGKILIVPAAGRLLKNPYFTPPGPVYHMLVVKGYDAARDEFITNDPGTKRGANLRYHANTLFNAIHDWNNGNVLNGKKMVLVVGK